MSATTEKYSAQKYGFDAYIQAFENVYEYDDVDTCLYDDTYLKEKVQESIDDYEFEDVIPTEQDMADVVLDALDFLQYGDTCDADDLDNIAADRHYRFPHGRKKRW